MDTENASQEESQLVVHDIIQSIDQDPKYYSSDDIQTAMQWLESYECWEYLLRILDQRIHDPKVRVESDYIWMAKIIWHYLDDREKGVKILSLMVEDLSPEFNRFYKFIASDILIANDFNDEVFCLEKCQASFKNKTDYIRCLERLCLLYEKKSYNEAKLEETFRKILKIDPSNLKALRYFKSVYGQMQEWTQVITILKKLHEASPILNDKFRLAHEMANVYLYHLDEPQSALTTLDRFCIDSPLDATTIRYQANYRLRNWSICLAILGGFLEQPENAAAVAVIYFKIGELKERMGLHDEAILSYEQCLHTDPNFIDAIENLVEIYIDKKDWNGIIKMLNHLAKHAQHEDDVRRVNDAITRIQRAQEER